MKRQLISHLDPIRRTELSVLFVRFEILPGDQKRASISGTWAKMDQSFDSRDHLAFRSLTKGSPGRQWLGPCSETSMYDKFTAEQRVRASDDTRGLTSNVARPRENNNRAFSRICVGQLSNDRDTNPVASTGIRLARVSVARK